MCTVTVDGAGDRHIGLAVDDGVAANGSSYYTTGELTAGSDGARSVQIADGSTLDETERSCCRSRSSSDIQC